MSSSESSQFTSKEQERISTLEATINDHRRSTNEKQIADAELSSLRASKLPPPHNHKHRLQRGAGAQADVEQQISPQERGGNITTVGKKDHDMYHNDEAFERYAMGHDQTSPPGRSTDKRGVNDWDSVRFNHHARGGQKMRAEDDIINEELMP